MADNQMHTKECLKACRDLSFSFFFFQDFLFSKKLPILDVYRINAALLTQDHESDGQGLPVHHTKPLNK